MRSKIWIIAASLALSACGTTGFIPVRTEYKLIKPDEKYLECDLTKTLPAADKLTDTQVANLINDLYSDNKICHNNMIALKQFYENADQIFKDQKKK